MSSCDVSVIIPNYNRTALLRRALESVAGQTLHPVEVIVIDDCSSSDQAGEVRAIVEDFNHCIPTKLLVNETNRGANFSRNRGIFDAKGRYLAFLDSDDVWMQEKLQMQMECIEAAKKTNTRPIFSATGRYRVNGDGDIIVRQFGGLKFNPEKIRRSNFIGTLSSVVVEKWVARHIRGFNESLSACQDWDFFIRLADYVQYVGVPAPLCVYVDHEEERITLNNRKRLRSHVYIYRTHLRTHLRSRHIPADFYRNIAEDYQEIGNPEKARKFLVKASSLRCSQRLAHASACFFNLLYWLNPPQSIKENRYLGYRKRMARMLQDPTFRNQIGQHQKIIKNMIRGAH